MQLVSLLSTSWIVIYPLDSTIWTFEQLGLQSLTSIGTASLATISNGLTNCMDSPSWVISTPLNEEFNKKKKLKPSVVINLQTVAGSKKGCFRW